MNRMFWAVVLFLAPTTGGALQPFKDDMFSNKNRKVLEARYSGAFKRYDWDEISTVNGRDAIPGKTAKPERVDLSVLKDQRDLKIPYTGGEIDTFEVGKSKEAKFAVIFIHGGGGDKQIGANDQSFGGNFNRIKNLAARNDGVYYSPTVETDRDVPELIKHIKRNSPNAKIIVTCGSAGAETCWKLVEARETADQVSGLIFQGGASTRENYESTPGFAAKIPIVISHGTKDPLVPWKVFEKQFEDIHKKDPKYPIRMETYEGGKHGTPLRMMDWKENIEWILSRAPTAPGASGGGAVSPPRPITPGTR
jgi:predicted esterase